MKAAPAPRTAIGIATGVERITEIRRITQQTHREIRKMPCSKRLREIISCPKAKSNPPKAKFRGAMPDPRPLVWSLLGPMGNWKTQAVTREPSISADIMASRPPPPALALLSTERNRAADAALLEALPHFESHARTTAVELLIRRGHAPTLTSLVRRFDDYDDDLKGLIGRRVGELHTVTRAAFASTTFEDRAGAIELIRVSGDGKLAYLLADAVRSSCHRTRELAAQALGEVTGRMVDGLQNIAQAPGVTSLHTQADALAEALRVAVQRWELHFQPKVLEAALWMGDRVEDAIREKLQEPATKVAHALCELIEAGSDPRMAGAVLRSLAIPVLRPSAARALARSDKPAFLRALARQGWLLADPEIEHGCRWVHEGPWGDGWLGQVRQLAESEAAAAVRLLGVTGGTPEWKIERFRGLLDDRRAEVRRAVLWQAIGDPSKQATDLLTLIAARTGDDTAEIAARECRRRRPANVASIGGTEIVSAAEGRAGAGDAFEAFFAEFSRLTSAEKSMLAGQMKGSITGLAERVRAKCASPNPIERSRAVRVAKALGLLQDIADEVYQLAHDREAVVRSTAVGALMELPGPTTIRILRNAVNDPDGRVQANAVEALDRLNVEDRVPYLKAKLNSPHSRVRANAVRALLRVELREAGEVLLDMLEDPSEAHRLSALWVIERMRLRSVLHRILEISHDDPDDRVRQRAHRVVRDFGPHGEPRSVALPATAVGGSVDQVGSA